MTIEYPTQRAIEEVTKRIKEAQEGNKLLGRNPHFDSYHQSLVEFKDKLELVKERGFGMVHLTLEEILEHL